MKKYILTIDQGTTGTTVSLMTHEGVFAERKDQDFRQIFPQAGWVEHNLHDIWETVTSTVDQLIKSSKINPQDILAIGITNQRETVAIWDRETHKPIHNAIVWQCRRTTEVCQKLKAQGHESRVRELTGLVLDPYFSATKIAWMLDHVPGARERAERGELACGTMDTFLMWQLSGGEVHATDFSNASRTLLMNLKTGAWDEDLTDLFKVPAELLPEILPSSGVFGVTKNCGILPDGIPIAGVAGDQQAALFGQACFEAGEAKCTYGTGSFLLMNTGTKRVSSKSGCLTTVAWKLSAEAPMIFALEGSAFICGAAVQWLRDGLGVIQSASEIEGLAGSVQDSGGVEFVPALTGLGAPYWEPEARGLICGLTRGSTRAHLARATLEGMALQNADILRAMEKDLGGTLKSLKVDGGASENNLLMKIQCDYLGSPLIRPVNVETTSSGAGFLAGLGVGFWKDLEEIKKVWKVDREFYPQMSDADRSARFKSWGRAVERAL